MALVFMDGFDHYAVGDIGKKWHIVSNDAGTLSMDSGRFSGQSLKQVTTLKDDTKYFVCNMPSPFGLTGGMGFALKISAYGIDNYPQEQAIASVLSGDGTAHLVLRLGQAGVLGIYRISGNQPTLCCEGGSVSLNQWTYIEWKWYIHSSSGTAEIRVNGVSQATFSGNTKQGVSQGAVCLFGVLKNYFGTTPTGYTLVGSAWLDDVYIFDGNAGITDFLGDVTVQARYPTGAGATSGFTPSAGDNYACVDEAFANGDTDYVTADALNELDTYAIDDVVAGADIKAVQVNVMARKTDAGAAAVAAVVRGGGVDRVHATPIGIGSTSYFDQRFIYEKDPETDAAWVDTGFNGSEFGLKKTT